MSVTVQLALLGSQRTHERVELSSTPKVPIRQTHSSAERAPAPDVVKSAFSSVHGKLSSAPSSQYEPSGHS